MAEENNEAEFENEIATVVVENGRKIYTLKPEIMSQGDLNALQQLLNDDLIEEIMYNNPQQPVKLIHKKLHSIDTNLMLNGQEAQQFVITVAAQNKKYVSEKSPVFDGVLPDGSRINVTVPPATPSITFTIRKFSHNIITLLDLINQKMLDPDVGAFLWTAVEGLGHHAPNMLVVGGTASGKTTFLNALILFVPQDERIITIEDTAEVRIIQQNRVSMFSSKEKMITMDMLLKNALRMRPDRIIVGEVRGAEANTLFNAMNTGHNGCMGTIHARSARETITRISNQPLNVPISMVRDLDMLIVLEKINADGEDRRIVSEITEIDVLAGDKVSFNQIYKYDPKKKKTLPTGIPSKLRTKIAQNSGIEIKEFDKILEDRSNILSIMAKKQDKENSLSTDNVFSMMNSNREHWKKYKGRKKCGIFKRKESELIDW